MADQNSNQSLIEFAKETLAGTTLEMKDGNQILVVPNGRSAVDLKPFMDKYKAKPDRTYGVSEHYTLKSFVQHFNRFKLSGDVSALFASEDAKRPAITGVYNYAADSDAVNAGWRDHRAIFHCMLSDEWKIWTERAKQTMDQLDFAHFIEDNIEDIQGKPDLDIPGNKLLKEVSLTLGYAFASQQEMLNLSRGVEINEDSKCNVKVNLQTGEKTLEFLTEHKDGQAAPLKLPGLFLINIPVFKDGVCYQLPVKLRYRMVQGSPAWGIDIYRQDNAFKDAYDEVCAQVAEQTSTVVFNGSAES